MRPLKRADRIDANDPGCVKTLRGIIAPGILGSVVMWRAKNGKICLPLGITTKSDFVFAQPRPMSEVECAAQQGKQ